MVASIMSAWMEEDTQRPEQGPHFRLRAYSEHSGSVRHHDNRRPYKKKYRPFDALDHLHKAEGQFDSNLTRDFILLLVAV